MSKFGDAFAAARKAGKKTFTFQGKSYNTKTKEEAGSARPKAKPKASSTRPPRNASKDAMRGDAQRNKPSRPQSVRGAKTRGLLGR